MYDGLEAVSEIATRRASCESVRTLLHEIYASNRPNELDDVVYHIYIAHMFPQSNLDDRTHSCWVNIKGS
jgi:hypothetical protein